MKKFFVRMLSSILSLKKEKSQKYTACLPTLFISCYQNLQTWINAREVALDLGKRFSKRIEFYISGFIIVYLSLCLILVMAIFEIGCTNLDEKEVLIGLWDIFVVFALILKII